MPKLRENKVTRRNKSTLIENSTENVNERVTRSKKTGEEKYLSVVVVDYRKEHKVNSNKRKLTEESINLPANIKKPKVINKTNQIIKVKDESVDLAVVQSKKQTEILSTVLKDNKNDLINGAGNIKNKKPLKEIEIPLDKECKELEGKAHIFIEDNNIYDVMLNQTNLQFNNNKFYIIQLLKDNNKQNYYVWMRWARVGKIGQMKLTKFQDNLSAAKECFMKKFLDKTRNEWENRNKFVKVNGKYDLLEIDYSKKENIEPIKKETCVKLEPLECKLEEKLQDLMRIIFDIKEMNNAVVEMNYDSNKIPLGRLTEAQIAAGYKALREIEGLLNEGHSRKTLVEACNAYYTRIPHDFGMRIPPLIQTVSEIKRELELLETLSDIKIALKLINESDDMHVHPLDRNYRNLHCDINSISPDKPIYQIINDYLLFTHGSTHTSYDLEMIDLFEIRKDQEWKTFQNHGNRMLLWHGSRTTNYAGIFSQGLRIAPKEAPVTGHMFGKGIYFADMSSKSANYVYPTKSKNIGFLLLCEVSLGTCNELFKANARASKLPPNFHSVKGLGIIEPEKSTWKEIDDGIRVPVGTPIDTKLAEKHKGYLLNYNEYIVYKQNQVKMRYLVKVRFNFK